MTRAALRRIEGLSQREAAQSLGIAEGALEGHMCRGLRGLADALFSKLPRRDANGVDEAYVRDDRNSADQTPPAVLFRYSPDRKAIYPGQHLESFNGILQADAYAGYSPLYQRANNPLLEAACWAHARRKFYHGLAARA